MSLLLLDIGHFKQFNDELGHQVGDDCLRAVAAAVGGAVRTTDIVARYGGEEIAVILPATNMAGATQLAEGEVCRSGSSAHERRQSRRRGLGYGQHWGGNRCGALRRNNADARRFAAGSRSRPV